MTYSQKIVKTTLSGPMSFGPAIRKTMELVKKSKPHEFTVCLLLCDGQPNTKEDTERAIGDASLLPIAIVAIGIGDGPWDLMRKYDDTLHTRKFDNFNVRGAIFEVPLASGVFACASRAPVQLTFRHRFHNPCLCLAVRLLQRRRQERQGGGHEHRGGAGHGLPV